MLETTPDATRVRAVVEETIAAVMAERGLEPREIASGAKLSEGLGLRSMDLAAIVLTLEDDLNVDPFREIPITSVRTVGDLTGAYLAALGLAAKSGTGVQDMTAEMAAARDRRARRRR